MQHNHSPENSVGVSSFKWGYCSEILNENGLCNPLISDKEKRVGAPGWLCGLSIRLLVAAEVTISWAVEWSPLSWCVLCGESTWRSSHFAPPQRHVQPPSLFLKKINNFQNGTIHPMSQWVGFLRTKEFLWARAKGTLQLLHQRAYQKVASILLSEIEGKSAPEYFLQGWLSGDLFFQFLKVLEAPSLSICSES